MSPTSSLPRRRSTRRAPPSLPFFLFIAYGDVAAARDAIDRVKQILGRAQRELAVQPMLWRFDQLGPARWREMALHDALRAHAIVLAMGNSPSLHSATDEWLTALVNRRAGAPINCVAFMGEEDAWTICLQRSDGREPAMMPSVAASTRRIAPEMSA